jgi:hypothetical protein
MKASYKMEKIVFFGVPLKDSSIILYENCQNCHLKLIQISSEVFSLIIFVLELDKVFVSELAKLSAQYAETLKKEFLKDSFIQLV